MTLLIEPLTISALEIVDLLTKDGWVLEDQDGKIVCSHEAVTDNYSARLRLQHLKLLTSSKVRIFFRPTLKSA